MKDYLWWIVIKYFAFYALEYMSDIWFSQSETLINRYKPNAKNWAMSELRKSFQLGNLLSEWSARMHDTYPFTEFLSSYSVSQLHILPGERIMHKLLKVLQLELPIVSSPLFTKAKTSFKSS